jgi:hypothetical protein
MTVITCASLSINWHFLVHQLPNGFVFLYSLHCRSLILRLVGIHHCVLPLAVIDAESDSRLSDLLRVWFFFEDSQSVEMIKHKQPNECN